MFVKNTHKEKNISTLFTPIVGYHGVSVEQYSATCRHPLLGGGDDYTVAKMGLKTRTRGSQTLCEKSY